MDQIVTQKFQECQKACGDVWNAYYEKVGRLWSKHMCDAITLEEFAEEAKEQYALCRSSINELIAAYNEFLVSNGLPPV